MRKILCCLAVWSVAAVFASCSDGDEGKENKWFQLPVAEVEGTTVDISCRTGFAEEVLAAADAGFAYATFDQGVIGTLVRTSEVTAAGNVLSCRLEGLEARTTYLAYAYVVRPGGERVQSDPVRFVTGENPVVADDPTFGEPDYSDITASSATVRCSFDYRGSKRISEAYFLYGSSSGGDLREAVTTSTGLKKAQLSGLSAATDYNFRLFVVVDGKTYGGKVGSFTTAARGQSNARYAGWAELPDEVDMPGDYYYAYHMRADLATMRNFSVCYSSRYRCPVWVAAPMHKSYKGNTKRKDNYIDDPDIPCAQNTSYNFSSTDLTRGHMLGSSDRTVSRATNDQVFFKSNIAPQYQTGFNTFYGAWNNCEDWVDTQWVGKADTTYQVIGCYWENESLRVNGTTVPTHFYKVLLRTKNHVNKWVAGCSREELQCVAILLPHDSSNDKLKPNQYVAKGYALSVADLEKKTGLTYFPNVPNAPKETFDPADWGL